MKHLLIVVSAVNLRKGGTLTILRECLQTLSKMADENALRVVALVHRKELADYPGIEYIELPWSVSGWMKRLWCEYVTMYGISKKLGDIDLWLSLHDTTPRVKAKRQAVYCHNPFPFFHWHWHHLWQNYRIVCFALFSKWIYRIHIHRNDHIVVQQQWLREAFKEMFGIAHDKIIVAPPTVHPSPLTSHPSSLSPHPSPFIFLYPAYPDVHKNFECTCEAARLLEEEVGTGVFELVLTTDTHLNRYSRWLYKKWGGVKSIRFGGFVDRDTLYNMYARADCLVFPSQVETWGLPISEFAATGKPMLLADLPYAHETSAGSKQTAFFDANSPRELKEMMKRAIAQDTTLFKPIAQPQIAPPTAFGWEELLEPLIYKRP